MKCKGKDPYAWRNLLRISLALLSFIACLSVQNAQASDRKLLWGYVNFPPFTSKGPNGHVQGFLADAAHNVLINSGVEYDAVQFPNRRIHSLFNTGDIEFGLFALSFVSEPAEFEISRFPVSRVELRAYWTGDKPAINKIEDLNGKRIILLSAYTYGGLRTHFFKPANEIEVVANLEKHDRAFEALRLGRGDYLLNYRGPSEVTLKDTSINELQYSVITTLDVHFILSKRFDNAAEVMREMENQFMSLYKGKILTPETPY